MRDQFSKHYEDLLEGGYDCADRIELNVYFPMRVSEGAFAIGAHAERLR